MNKNKTHGATQEETKTAYLLVSANRFGVQLFHLTTDYEEIKRMVDEEFAQGRRVKVSSREIPA